MIFGTKQFKNGKQVGYLNFSEGKKIYLTSDELCEFKFKIREWQYQAIEKEKEKSNG